MTQSPTQIEAAFRISVILLTYQWPAALQRVLSSLRRQRVLPDEVIVADDGSAVETKTCVERMQADFPCPLYHVWQEDKGFRAAAARNRAAATAGGDYLIFLDGDCLVFPDFILRHKQLAERGWQVVGNRILLNQALSQQVLNGNQNPLAWGWREWTQARRKGQVNRLAPLLRFGNGRWRKLRPKRWRGAQSCNLAIWRSDFQAVNGFDEAYQGWGHEDADLVVRLMNAGCMRKDGNFSLPVLHLWHQALARDLEPENIQRLESSLRHDAP